MVCVYKEKWATWLQEFSKAFKKAGGADTESEVFIGKCELLLPVKKVPKGHQQDLWESSLWTD